MNTKEYFLIEVINNEVVSLSGFSSRVKAIEAGRKILYELEYTASEQIRFMTEGVITTSNEEPYTLQVLKKRDSLNKL